MKVATGVGLGLAAVVPAGLVVGHERLFLAKHSPDRRARNTRLVSQQFAGVGAVGTGAVSWMARHGAPASRVAIAAGGAALSAAPLITAEAAIRTGDPAVGADIPFNTDPNDGVLDKLPQLGVRAGEIALIGGAAGAGIGAVRPGGWGAAGKGLGLGATAGAVIGAAAFAIAGPIE